MIMLLENKNITVVGMGATGIATASFLVSRGALVTLIDSKSQAQLEKTIHSLNPFRSPFEEVHGDV